jgi:hypothetical protein
VKKRSIIVNRQSFFNLKFSLEGNMFSFSKGDGLYLSGSPSFNTHSLDFYSNIRSVSADNPPFSGTPIPYKIDNNNHIEFSLPKSIPLGVYDIVFCNPAGYVLGSSIPSFNKIIVKEFKKGKITSIGGDDSITTFAGDNIVTIGTYLL